ELLGKALSLLAERGLDLSEVALTNAVRCWPKGKEGDEPPTLNQQRACRVYLDAEIEVLKPEVIVALGASALAGMLDVVSASVAAHRLKRMDYRGTPLFCTFHPAACLRTPAWKRELLSDLSFILLEQGWKMNRKRARDAGYEVTEGNLPQRGRIGFDVETEGLYGKLLLVGVEQEGVVRIVPADHPEAPPHSGTAHTYIRGLVASPEVELVGQNLKYDIACALRYGEWFAPRCLARDTMMLHSILAPASPTRSLKYLLQQYTDLRKDEVDAAHLVDLPFEDVAAYCAHDVAGTVVLERRLTEELRKRGRPTDRLEALCARMVPLVASIEAAGVRVDVPALKALEARLARKEGRLRRFLRPATDPDSPEQVSEYLFGKGGLKLKPPRIKGLRGKEGWVSTREDVLQRLLPHPWIEKLLAYREVAGLRSRYTTKFEQLLTPEGFVFPRYHLTKSEEGGTVTGRLSASEPSIQNLPREGFRHIVVSRFGKGVLVNIDAAQLELRVAAWITGDPYLLRVFEEGRDLHAETAALTGLSRDEAKGINFGCVYGVTVDGAMEKFGLDRPTARLVSSTLSHQWAVLYGGLASLA
ncbi:MAG: DNA polymerase, partial [candidate division NC10 bacterium]|nr:DNA polymerase [candidate division NC10 bacterium]